MDFKLISKNNIGTVVLLLLVIALSQARAFNFLIDSALGRFFLIIFILCLSHCNKILGVVGVLFIVIMFNSNMYSEGFETASGKTITKPDDTKVDMTKVDTTKVDTTKVDTTNVDPTKLKENVQKKLSETKTNIDAVKSTLDASSTAVEGFDILGIENNIKRGKQSNSIPVNNLMRDSNSISPYEGTSFLGSFSPF
jgi:hypothetical protein